jgi:hypothetical protein
MSTVTVRPLLGALFSRLLVPFWLLTGALFKLYFDAPSALPKGIWQAAHNADVDLDVFLHSIIAVELVLVGVMLFWRSMARLTAIVVMSTFVLILLNELRIGSSSCGCMGEFKMPTEIMLIIDGSLLIGTLLCPLRRHSAPEAATATPAPSPAPGGLGIGLAVLWIALSAGVAFGVPALTSNTGDEIEPPVEGPTDDPDQPPAINQTPPSYYVFSPDEWTGQEEDLHFYKLGFVPYLTKLPSDITEGRRYVVLYSRTCDHCKELLDLHFAPASLPVPATLIAVPESKDGYTHTGVYKNDATGCEQIQMRTGCDWLLSPPILIALENGYVKCAEEVQDSFEPNCLLWH